VAMQEELRELSRKLQEQTGDAGVLEESNAKLVTALNAAETQRTELMGEIARLEKALGEAEERVMSVRRDSEVHQAGLREFRHVAEASATQVITVSEEAAARSASLELSVAKWKTAAETAQSQLERLHGDATSLKQRLEATVGARDEEAKAKVVAEANVVRWRERCLTAETKAKTVEQQAMQQVETAREEAERVGREATQLRQHLQTTSRARDEETNAKRAAETALAAWRERCMVAESRVSEVEMEVQTETRRAQGAERDANAAAAHARELQSVASSNVEELAMFRREMADVLCLLHLETSSRETSQLESEVTVSALRAELSAVGEAVRRTHEWEERARRAEAREEALREELLMATAAGRSLEADVVRLEREVGRLQSRGGTSAAHSSASHSNVELLETQLATATQEVGAQREVVAKLQARNKVLEAESARRPTSLKRTSSSLDFLAQCIDSVTRALNARISSAALRTLVSEGEEELSLLFTLQHSLAERVTSVAAATSRPPPWWSWQLLWDASRAKDKSQGLSHDQSVSVLRLPMFESSPNKTPERNGHV